MVKMLIMPNGQVLNRIYFVFTLRGLLDVTITLSIGGGLFVTFVVWTAIQLINGPGRTITITLESLQ